jgi:hypothetical protein
MWMARCHFETKGTELESELLSFVYVAGCKAETESANVEPVNFVADFLVSLLVALLAPFIAPALRTSL